MAGGEVRLVRLVKRFEDVAAVDGIDLEVRSGELFSLLGPSGCGKTTTTQLVVRLAHGEALRALVQNQGSPLPWRQGTAVAAHLPADALRVLPDASAGAGA